MWIASNADKNIKEVARQKEIKVLNIKTTNENSLKLEKNIDEIKTYRIYGNTEQGVSLGTYNEIENAYKIPVTVSGKNMIDIDSAVNTYLTKEEDGIYNMQKTSSGRFARSLSIKLEANKSYVFSYELIETNSTYSKPLQFICNGLYYGFNGKNTVSVVVPEHEITNIQMYQEGNMPVGTYTKFKKLQLEVGTVATEYEPYVTPRTYEIILEEPLRSKGDVADYIDFAKQKVIRKISEDGEVLNTPVEEKVDLSAIKLNKGVTNIITIDTHIKPSRIEIEY